MKIKQRLTQSLLPKFFSFSPFRVLADPQIDAESGYEGPKAWKPQKHPYKNKHKIKQRRDQCKRGPEAWKSPNSSLLSWQQLMISENKQKNFRYFISMPRILTGCSLLPTPLHRWKAWSLRKLWNFFHNANMIGTSSFKSQAIFQSIKLS